LSTLVLKLGDDMSDKWYRGAEPIPPYEDWQGNLWTYDGVCLNPVHGCEVPDYMHDLAMLDIQAELIMSYWEKLAE
jgi:hypothetical protein